MPRDLVLSLEEGSTIRDVLEVIRTRFGGQATWLMTKEGGLEGSVQIAVDGEVVERDQLDRRLPPGRTAISLFVMRAIFGGAGFPSRVGGEGASARLTWPRGLIDSGLSKDRVRRAAGEGSRRP